ncbi:MAG: gamma-glutamylcyclotransferase family protein [Planctomycetota bacterium]
MPEPGCVFGYGSLIDAASRGRQLANSAIATPVRVRGLRRSWNTVTTDVGLTCTFLGVTRDPDAVCNGVIATVNADEWPSLDAREAGYRRVPLERSQVEWLRPADADRFGDTAIDFYETIDPTRPTPERPIIQSYVDICLGGCLAVDDDLQTGDRFTREFIETTSGWSGEWVNDRLYPRAPFRYVPRAFAIDRLLHEGCAEGFAAMRIE